MKVENIRILLEYRQELLSPYSLTLYVVFQRLCWHFHLVTGCQVLQCVGILFTYFDLQHFPQQIICRCQVRGFGGGGGHHFL
jgi:hypothetical protein